MCPASGFQAFLKQQDPVGRPHHPICKTKGPGRAVPSFPSTLPALCPRSHVKTSILACLLVFTRELREAGRDRLTIGQRGKARSITATQEGVLGQSPGVRPPGFVTQL